MVRYTTGNLSYLRHTLVDPKITLIVYCKYSEKPGAADVGTRQDSSDQRVVGTVEVR